MKTSNVRAALALMVTASGCASIAGFDDLSRECPESTPNCADGGAAADSGTSGNGGSSGSAGVSGVGGSAGDGGSAATLGRGGSAGNGASGGEGSCNATTHARGGPTMAKIRRPDETCFWIDTTEVTEAQYAEYLATNPAPSDDTLCTGPADPPSSPCQSRASLDGGRPDPKLPKTCVDWCGARDFCQWAGKKLCHDDLRAIGPDQLLRESDYYAACTESGKKPAPLGEDCGYELCNVDKPAPLPAGEITACYTLAADGTTPVYDLIGNVEEWTEWCFSNVENSDCAIRGSSFRSTREQKCCEQLSQFPRRQATTTLGFRCCAYP